MARHGARSEPQERTVVLGIRVSPRLKASVKVEAARRGVSVAELFQDLWDRYKEGANARTESPR
jgi:hypothetical protein